ncbi:MAG: hypothetical protein V8R43_05905 [Dorea sp.]
MPKHVREEARYQSIGKERRCQVFCICEPGVKENKVLKRLMGLFIICYVSYVYSKECK